MNKGNFLKGWREFSEQNRMVPAPYNRDWRLIISEIWCLLRYGARPVDYVRFEFWKKNDRERNRYLTWGRYMRMKKLFGLYNESTYGKIAEYKTFADYIHRPWIIADKDSEPQTITDFVSRQGTVFAKPNHGDQGKGVMKIKADDNSAIEALINDCKKDAFVVEGVIEQIPEIAAINPSSINTVRAYTLLKKNGESEIAMVATRRTTHTFSIPTAMYRWLGSVCLILKT